MDLTLALTGFLIKDIFNRFYLTVLFWTSIYIHLHSQKLYLTPFLKVSLLQFINYNPKSEKVGTVWKTQIKKESSDF